MGVGGIGKTRRELVLSQGLGVLLPVGIGAGVIFEGNGVIECADERCRVSLGSELHTWVWRHGEVLRGDRRYETNEKKQGKPQTIFHGAFLLSDRGFYYTPVATPMPL